MIIIKTGIKEWYAACTVESLKKTYPDLAAFHADRGSTLGKGGVLLDAAGSGGERRPVKVEIVIGGRTVAELDGEVVYAAGTQVGVEFKGDWEASLALAEVKFHTLAEEEEAGRYGKDAESVFHAVSKMSTHEKIQLAIKGGKEERRILMKDAHYAVHPYVLKNPRITAEEVVQFARMPSITGEMIHTIASNTDWMQNAAVRLGIIKNPKTPLNIVEKYVPKLNDHDLLQLAKSDHVRDAVSRAAKRALAGRGKPVPA